MAFRKKAGIILALQPDILVIPECEHPDKLKFNPEISKPVDTLWFGTNPNKGLGIFSYSNLRFTVLDVYNPDLKMVIPISVKGKNIDFILFAIWANNPGDPDGHYVEQVWKAIHHYDDLLTIRTTLKELPTDHKIEFHCEVFNENKKLLTVGRVVLFFVTAREMQKTTMPVQLYDKLRPFFGS